MKINNIELSKLSIADLNGLIEYCRFNIKAFPEKEDYYLLIAGHCMKELDKKIDKLIA